MTDLDTITLIGIQESFSNINDNILKFCDFISNNQIDTWEFSKEIKDFFDYKNQIKTIYSYNSFNHELKIEVNDFIYLILNIYLNMNCDKEWSSEYKQIFIVDKNGVIIEEITY